MARRDPAEPDALDDPRLDPYDYPLDDALIARHPPEDRDGGRLLDLSGPALRLGLVRELPELLREGDLLVVNDTRVMHARLRAKRASGGAVELLLLSAEDETEALLRPARRVQVGERLQVSGPDGAVIGEITLLERPESGLCRVRCAPGAAALMAAAGEVPLPPYLRRAPVPEDAARYQTVFAGAPGAVAAPTAGLHLTEAMLQRLSSRGVAFARLTLHVGAGTFQNLRPADLNSGLLHEEPYLVPEETAAAVAACRARGGRVVAVGTTSARTLESAALPGGLVRAGPGRTRLFIREGHVFGVVDAMFTNLHLPRSSLLLLVSALGGRERVMQAYEAAVAARFRFFSYGDAMFVCPHTPGAPVGAG
jgi:S-adenosylmethionine:tRNA ribosyltransferase-isomerase